jgi:hypothetical protein
MFSLELDFKQFLLETATIAQQLRNPKFVPPDVVKEVKNNIRTLLASQGLFYADNAKHVDRYASYFTYWGLHHYATYHAEGRYSPDEILAQGVVARILGNLNALFAEKGHREIVRGWTMNQARRWLADWGDYIAAHFDDNRIQSQFNNLAFTPEMVDEAVKDWHYRLSLKQRLPGGEGRMIIKLGGQWKGWKWLSLDRESCDEEAEAGGHCGNANWAEGDNILSLRDPENRVHLTFIINNGILGEMKGHGNTKPSKKLHPPILELLRSQYVGSIKGGGYLPENNFMLSDLDRKTRKKLIKKKPYLNKPFKYLISTARSNDEILKALEDIFPDTGFRRVEDKGGSKEIIFEEFDDMAELSSYLRGYKKSIDDFSWLENPWQYFDDDYGYTTSGIESALDYHVNSENKKLLEKYFEKVDKLNSKDEDEDEDDEYEESLFEKIDQDDDLRSAFGSAYEDGATAGAEAEAWKDVKYQLGSEDERGFYVKMDQWPATLRISMNDLEKIHADYTLADEVYGFGDLVDLMDLSYSAPYHGYSEFDDDSFNERLKELVEDAMDGLG